MNLRTFVRFCAIALLTLISLFPTLEAAEAKAEDTRIRALISHVESLDDAVFIRNGKEYSPKQAAEFLRRKWEAHRESVRSASDFITKIASKSSTSGKPYLIRLKGKTVRCGDYLAGQLEKLPPDSR